MKSFILSILCLMTFGLKAQKIYDEKAENLLNRVSSHIKSNDLVKVDFTFSVDYPGAEKTKRSGSLEQTNEEYFVSIGDNEILSTSNAFYLIDRNAKSVQVNDPLSDDDTDFYNPISLMEKYNSGEFEYAIVGEDKINEERCYLVEFKPTDRFSELSKIRIALNMESEELVYVKIFNKDATRIDIEIESMMLTMESQQKVVFDEKLYEGFVIEDLRID